MLKDIEKSWLRILGFIQVVLLTACASHERKLLEEIKTRAPDKVIRVSSESAAKTAIEDQVNYLKNFFQSNVDPYTGAESVSKFCQSQNQFGVLEKDSRGYIQIAKVLASNSGKIGACPEFEGTRLLQILIYSCEPFQAVTIHNLFKFDSQVKPLRLLEGLCSGK